MDISAILQAIDQQIKQLHQARALLSDNAPVKRGPGRPKSAKAVVDELVAPKKRPMSAEGKARIAAAQKKRWALQQAAAKPAKKSTPAAKKSERVAGTKQAKKVAAAPVKKAAKKSAPAPKKAAAEHTAAEAAS